MKLATLISQVDYLYGRQPQAYILQLINDCLDQISITSKMYNPVSHLDDCNLNHYNLQLSLYAYIIKKHNPKLKIGKLQIQHVKFKKIGDNEHGYPITEKNEQGEPIIEDIKIYTLKYLKDEVQSIIKWLKDNPQC